MREGEKRFDSVVLGREAELRVGVPVAEPRNQGGQRASQVLDGEGVSVAGRLVGRPLLRTGGLTGGDGALAEVLGDLLNDLGQVRVDARDRRALQ